MNNPLILGSKGMLGGQLMKLSVNPLGWDRDDVDVLNFDEFKNKVLALPENPSVIINCVAFNDVDAAEEHQDIAYALNAEFVGKLATFCRQINVPLVHFSTNYIFDGEQGEYAEEDEPNPQSVYAKSKYEGEKLIPQNTNEFHIVRTSVLFGPKGESELSKKSFIEIMLGLAETQKQIKAVNDEINSITLVTDLAQTVKYIVNERKPYGVYHAVNQGQASWYDLAKEIFYVMKKDIELIPVPSSEFPRKAPRPKKSVLINSKLPKLQPWPDAVKEFLVKNYLSKNV